jgi:endoglucanase
MEWKMKTWFKYTTIAIAAAFCASAMAEDITPTRVGPVSQYGKLIAGKNSQNKGQIYGSCEGVKDGAEVQVRGMSLYWSLMDEALDFWSEDGITTMVKDMKIQIVRAAMAAGNEDWTKGKYIGYAVQPDSQTQFVKRVVEAAIKQDIYVIIDWHSHTANTQTQNAVKFFGEMAQAYGQYDNVIFEVFNEPQKIEWSVIKTYADAVVAEIRKYSDNLILVGTPEWDQFPNRVIGSEINDPKQNTAYTFHYYAGTHCFSGKHEGMFGQSWPCEGENAVEAMNAGLSVFVSEWGVTTSDGKGSVACDNDGWQNWMNEHKLSWANWSASKIPEGSAAFSSGATKTSLQYSNSGNQVKGYLSSNPASYTKCAANGGNNEGNNGGNNNTAIFMQTNLNFNVTFSGNALHIAGTSMTVEIFSTKGDKLMAIDNVSGTLSLAKLPAGMYVAKIRGNGTNMVRAIQVK